MRYKVLFTDGSEEVVSGASDISEAREMAKEAYDLAPVQRVVALDDSDEEDVDEDGDEDAENPEDDGDDE